MPQFRIRRRHAAGGICEQRIYSTKIYNYIDIYIAPPVQGAKGDTTTCASGLAALVAEWKSSTSASCNSALSGRNIHIHTHTCTCNYPAKTGYAAPIQRVSYSWRQQDIIAILAVGRTALFNAAEWPLSGVDIIIILRQYFGIIEVLWIKVSDSSGTQQAHAMQLSCSRLLRPRASPTPHMVTLILQDNAVVVKVLVFFLNLSTSST